ncbi:tetratricopeptide repeat (TPR)-like superfamily protein [Actinidia rufa]|uniref:Tetratricopeptide repeat (TPR)-like superfamily protein n=1 Tax=Actinidia rufa TaxID=165716 RepID=A0A7J0EE01_9ERIC|nr:tetratricopeptide repeat (TPR)-like superfamily protein [Actinidia rufa]
MKKHLRVMFPMIRELGLQEAKANGSVLDAEVGPKHGKAEHAHGKRGGVELGPRGADNFKHKKGKRGGKKTKAKGTWFNCGKPLHFTRDCTESKKATKHITSSRVVFIEYHRAPASNRRVYMGNESSVEVLSVGTYNLEMRQVAPPTQEKAEQVFEPDLTTQATLARHYVSVGLKEKAEDVLKEMEGDNIKENRWACHALLPLYAALGKADEVERVWKVCKSNPKVDECLAAIESWGKLNKVEEAEAVFDSDVGLAPSVGTTVPNLLCTCAVVYGDQVPVALDNRARPMANISQASNLEGLHREIHGMAEQMRIMNENNAHLIQLLTANNPARLAPPAPSQCSHRPVNNESQSHHSTGRDQRRRSPIPRQRERSSSSESRSSSETPEIEGEEVRRRGRSPRRNDQLGAYGGKTDHMDHLHSYKSLMLLHGYSDEVMCKAFSTTLKGSARTWFRKLPLRTIDSFGDLSKLFVANFISCRVRKKSASHLFIVHQKETESLKDYIKRFNHAVLDLEYPSDKIVIMAMMEGLRPGPLFDSLSKKVPVTLSALQSKANKYITAEELAEAK